MEYGETRSAGRFLGTASKLGSAKCDEGLKYLNYSEFESAEFVRGPLNPLELKYVLDTQ